LNKTGKKNLSERIAGSIFSGGGLGDVGIEWGCGIPVLGACEIVPSRASLIRQNFPNTKVFEGDIWKLKDAYIDFFQKQLQGQHPWLITLSPPCQGMSSNGAGRIASSIRAGKRPKDDERNRLILPGLDVLESLLPDWFLLENVKRMENTVIRNESDLPENILDCVARRMHPLGYTIRSCILDFRDYGVPHHRERLITIGCRLPQVVDSYPSLHAVFSKDLSPLHPPRTHGNQDLLPWVTLRDMTADLSPLDAHTQLVDPEDPYHCIPPWNDKQYYWMHHTPEGQTAFDNDRCPHCDARRKKPHQTKCLGCDFPLPIPQLVKDGKARLIRGFRTSYRRMWWDRPAGTLTMNSGVISSDLKGHPEQNRVLSLREIMRLATLDSEHWSKCYDFGGVPLGKWNANGTFSPRLVREVIGESIPPLAMTKMVRHLIDLEEKICK
jgi:DNA (cytosine-5)-methyltransferase 1